MDKKIYIDGVDVSECDNYSYNHNELMPYGDVKITEHYCYHVNRECNGKDCDYKQLQRLKEENEKLNKMTGIFSARLCEKYRQALQEIRNKLDFNKQELEECLYNPIDDEIREIINSAIGVK